MFQEKKTKIILKKRNLYRSDVFNSCTGALFGIHFEKRLRLSFRLTHGSKTKVSRAKVAQKARLYLLEG